MHSLSEEGDGGGGVGGKENLLCGLVTKLGTTYDDEEHGIALWYLAVLAGDSKRELHKEAFVGWYMRLLFEDYSN